MKHLGRYLIIYAVSAPILVPKENIDMYNQKIFVHEPENICVCCVVRDKDKAWLLNKRRRDHSPAPGSGSEPEDSISYIEGYNYNKICTNLPIYS